jgi:hypothetical protein
MQMEERSGLRLMGVVEAARTLGVSKYTLLSYGRRNLIEMISIGRRRLVRAEEVARIAREGIAIESREEKS